MPPASARASASASALTSAAPTYIYNNNNNTVADHVPIQTCRLQGTITAEEIYLFLKGRGRLDGYPLVSCGPLLPPPSPRRPRY